MKLPRKLVSLADELSAIEQAVDGLRLMVEALLIEQVGRAKDVERAPIILSAMAGLIGARVKLVMRVVAGYADPATMHSRALNDVTGINQSETRDVILKEWSDEQVAEHAREDLRRLEARATTKAERKKKP